MKSGLFGGTFDPPHIGHLEAAKAALQLENLDEVLLVPCAKNPLKPRRPVASTDQRLQMVSMSVESESMLGVSDIEASRGGPSYTVDTLEELGLVRPGEYVLIVGSDTLGNLAKWKRPRRLVELASLCVLTRDGDKATRAAADLPEELSARVTIHEVVLPPVSSSMIRDEFGRGLDPSRWLHPKVAEFIRKVGLYR